MTPEQADEKVKTCLDQWTKKKPYEKGYAYLGHRIGLGTCCAEVHDDGTLSVHAFGIDGSKEHYNTLS